MTGGSPITSAPGTGERAPAREATARERMVRGSSMIFVAESLGLPASIITLALLSRTLDTAAFGVFSIAFTLVALAELALLALLARGANRLVSGAADWRSAGEIVLRLYVVTSLVFLAALLLAAPALGRLLALPGLPGAVALLALDLIPFALSQAHRTILVATNRFRERAIAAAVGLVSRTVLTLLFVSLRPTVTSALLAIIVSSVVEFGYGRSRVQPRLFVRLDRPFSQLSALLGATFVAAIAELALARIDLVALKSFGASAEQAGVYAGAQRLSLVPGLIAVSIAGPLLSSLSEMLRAGERDEATHLVHEAFRAALYLMPFAAFAAGMGNALATLVLGSSFAGAGAILAVLIGSAFARVVVVVANIALLAADRARTSAILGLVVLVVALAAYGLCIPRYGAGGAAAVTLGASLALAVSSYFASVAVWHFHSVAGSLARSLLLSAILFFVARSWPAAGVWVMVKVGILSLLVPLGYRVLGEWSRRDLTALRATFFRRPAKGATTV